MGGHDIVRETAQEYLISDIQQGAVKYFSFPRFEQMNRENVLEMSLIELINRSDLSVRLTNSINRAAAEGRMPFTTVGDYINAGNSAISEILKIQNLGRKSTLELDKCIRSFVESGGNNQLQVSSSPKEDKSYCIKELLADSRLADNIPHSYWDHWRDTICEHSNLRECFIHEVLNAIGFQWPSSRRNEKLSDYCAFSLIELFSIPGIGRSKRRLLILAYAYAAECMLDRPVDVGNEEKAEASCSEESHQEGFLGDDVSIERLFDEALNCLNDREKDIIASRFGIGGRVQETLEEIGERLGVTRERIRQIESKALRKLKNLNSAGFLRRFIELQREDIFRNLSANGSVVLEKRLGEAAKCLSGEQRCAIKVLYGSEESWLNEVARRAPLGWYLYPCAAEDIEDWKEAIRSYIRNVNLPRPVVSLIEPLQLSEEELELALTFMPEVSTLSGYIVEGNISARKRRCVQLHLLMTSKYGTKPAPIENIREIYNYYYPRDRCSWRDLEIVMTDATHLFINLNESGWFPLCHVVSLQKLDSREEKDGRSLNLLKTNESEQDEYIGNDNLVGILHEILDKEGPMPFIGARERFSEIAGDRYSPNSVLPTLITNTAFVRLAPGIIGTKRQLSEIDPVCGFSPILLRASQCKIYVLAKKAAPPVIEYPFWTPRMEYEWCKWAEKNADKALFQSLLAVCSPNDWPVSHNECQWWSRRKAREGFYNLNINVPRSKQTAIDLDDLFAVALYTYIYGSINWMVANRITGRRIDDQHIISVLGLLVCAGVIIPTGNWQESHQVGARANDFILMLTKERAELGVNSWSKVNLQIFEVNKDAEDTWVDPRDLEHWKSNILVDDKLKIPTSAGHGLNEVDTLDGLIEKQRRRRMEERLQRLLEEGDE